MLPARSGDIGRVDRPGRIRDHAPSTQFSTLSDQARHTWKMLRAALLVAVGILTCSSLLAAGGCAAGQPDPSRPIAQAINGLPGVVSTSHSFSIGWYDTFTVYLDANVRPEITPEQLTAIWEVFSHQVEKAGAGHAHVNVRLTINDCPSTVAQPDRYCGGISETTDMESAEPVPNWQEWRALIRGHYGNDIRVNTSHVKGQSRKQITVALPTGSRDKPAYKTFRHYFAVLPPISRACARQHGPLPQPADRHRHTETIWNSVPRADYPPTPSSVSGKRSLPLHQ